MHAAIHSARRPAPRLQVARTGRAAAAVLIALVCAMATALPVKAQTITTLVGDGIQSAFGDGGSPTNARLSLPSAVWGDTTGVIYIADTGNNRIRKIDSKRITISTVTGTGSAGFSGDGGPDSSAQISAPAGVFVDSTGAIYIADTGNNRIRKISTGGTITTFAGQDTSGFAGDGGPATAARLNGPTAVFARGTNVYIADTGNNRIRRVNSAGIITTIAGHDTTAGLFIDDTTATAATLNAPRGLFVDRANNIYIADTNHHRIRKFNAADSTLSTVVGNGSPGFAGDGDLPTNARLAFPEAVAVDTFGTLYIADRFNHRIRRVNPAGNITTIAGTGSSAFGGDNAAANRADLAGPSGLFLGRRDTLFIADASNHRLRRIVPDDASGPSGATTLSPGSERKLLHIALAGDGATTVNGLSFTVSDLASATGLSTADFVEFTLYESSDTTLGGDTIIGRIEASDITLGTQATIATTTFPTPATGVTRYYILAARFAKTAVQGHALRLAADTGALSTNQGGRGARIYARDADKLTIDVTATKLIFKRQPSSGLNGVALTIQPIVAAVDDSGFVDFDFRDTVIVSTAGTGTLLQVSAIADSGLAVFTNLIYSTSIDDEAITLTAKNQSDSIYTTLDSVVSDTLKINVVNDAPVVDFPALVLKEDETLGFRTPIEKIVSDADDTTFTITFSSNYILASVSGDSIIVLPPKDWFGIDTLTVTASDPFGLSHSDQGIIEVQAVNDAPVLSLGSVLNFAEDETLRVDMTTKVSDVDDSFANLQWSFTPSTGLSSRYTSSDSLLQLWADTNVSGTFSLSVRVTDVLELSDADTISISIAAVNDTPTLALRDTFLLQGASVAIDLATYTSDVDNTPSTLSWTAAADSLLNIAIDANGLATVTPDSTFSGLRPLVFTVADSGGATSTDTLQLTVLRVNQSPVFSAALPDTTLVPGDSLLVNLADFASDPDDDVSTLIWSVGGAQRLQSQLSGSQLSLVVPLGTEAYAETISVRVFDLLGFSAQDTFRVQVEPQIPPIAGLPDVEFEAGRLFVLDLSPYLGQDITSLVAGANDSLQVVINVSAQQLTLSANSGFKGSTDLVLQAGDARGSASTDTLAVLVSNPPPAVEGFPDIFLDAGFTAQLALDTYARDDEDVSLLSWSATPDPGLQVSIHGVLHIATISAGQETSGLKRIFFSATDVQGASAGDTLRVNVHGVSIDTTATDTTATDTTGLSGNSAPRLSAIPALRFHVGTSPRISLDRYAEDDGPLSLLAWNASSFPDSLVSIAIDATRTATVSALQDTGIGVIVFQVTNPDGLSASQEVAVEVRPPLAEPEAGDFDRDGRITFVDFFRFVDALGLTPLHPDWDPAFDLNDDGQITLDDFFRFVDAFVGFNQGE